MNNMHEAGCNEADLNMLILNYLEFSIPEKALNSS